VPPCPWKRLHNFGYRSHIRKKLYETVSANVRHSCLRRHTMAAKQFIYTINIIMSAEMNTTELFHDATSKSSPLKSGPASSVTVYWGPKYFRFVSRDRDTQVSLPTACVSFRNLSHWRSGKQCTWRLMELGFPRFSLDASQFLIRAFPALRIGWGRKSAWISYLAFICGDTWSLWCLRLHC